MCKYKMQMSLKRCKQCVRFPIFLATQLTCQISRSFELGGEKKTKGAALTFVRCLSSLILANPNTPPTVIAPPSSFPLFARYVLSSHEYYDTCNTSICALNGGNKILEWDLSGMSFEESMN